MIEIVVHPHALKHDLTEEQILYAWENFIRKQYRRSPDEDKILALGYDKQARLIQMVGRDTTKGVLIYHAMTPPSDKALRELNLMRR